MYSPLVLVVDDEPDLRELLSLTLSRMKLRVVTAENVTTAKKKLSAQAIDLCLTDLCLPDGTGLDIIDYIQSQQAGLPVAVITAHATVDTAIQALKNGAFDFVMKPLDIESLRNLVRTALKVSQVPTSDRPTPLDRLVGASGAMQTLKKNILRLSKSQAPIYISGPSGSGKELVAKLLHDLGPRRDNPFVPVNCGAISRELMESEFFGHQKGSFTGAIQDKIGLFESAKGGTLFLDEVAELPLDMQVKLLRAIQEKAIRRVGSVKEIKVDVRILSATHKNLQDLVEAKTFREDLFYRINVIEIPVPPLKSRLEDIPLLCDFLLKKWGRMLNTKPPILSQAALEALEAYDFPGNVRELENILERAVTLSEGESISVSALQLKDRALGLKEVKDSTPRSALEPNRPLEEQLDNLAIQAIQAALQKTRGNKTQAAKSLGMSLRALRYRLKKAGLD